ncbi:MAG: small multi-drug export protein [Firmicutes bacterium]|nr:small multi-drug export protein [Bacillota bacterium]
MADSFIAFFSTVEPHLAVFFLSMLPVTELRGALPLSVLWGLTPMQGFLWAAAGNFVPVIPLLLFLPWAIRSLSSKGPLRRPFQKLIAHNRDNQDKVRRWGMLGLYFLVAVPLPMTGVWTGCLVASLMSLPFGRSLIAVSAGILTAGMIMTLLLHGAVALVSWPSGGKLLLAAFAVLTVVFLCRRLKK